MVLRELVAALSIETLHHFYEVVGDVLHHDEEVGGAARGAFEILWGDYIVYLGDKWTAATLC